MRITYITPSGTDYTADGQGMERVLYNHSCTIYKQCILSTSSARLRLGTVVPSLFLPPTLCHPLYSFKFFL